MGARARESCWATGTARAACCAGTRAAPSSSRWRARVETKRRVAARDELGLETRERLDARGRIDAGARRRARGEIEVHLEVARLGGMQSLEQLADRPADGRSQGGEALAGARLDNSAADHEIDLALRFGPCDQAPQPLRIAPRREAPRGDPEPLDELRDLLVVAQFLARETRHLLGEFEILRVREHERERGRRRLLLAIRMVDEQ